MKQLAIAILFILLITSCKTSKSTAESSTTDNGLIKDCPEELINNQMPTLGKTKRNSNYYIYKGERKEINEFDSVWVSKHCKVKVTTVQ